MLIRAERLQGASILATDGKIGRLTAFLVDDEQWAIRYLVVKRGLWIFGREYLVSPLSVTAALSESDIIRTSLSRAEVKSSPSTDLAKPVSRRMEEQLHSHYRIPVYWGGGGLWAGAITPVEAGSVGYLPPSIHEQTPAGPDEYHLNKSNEFAGLDVLAEGEQVGRIADLLIEDTSWAIRYLRIEATVGFPVKQIYVSPNWVKDVDWIDEQINVDLTAEELRNAPEVGRNLTLLREEEARLHKHFKRPRYWE